MKWVKILVVVMSVILIGGFIWYFAKIDEVPQYKTQPARIKSIRQMVDLCTMDIHEEVPVKDSINGKWIVARQTIEGRVRFDLDSLRIEERGDTTYVYLPPERVDILEGAGPSAYQVLDSWDGTRMAMGRTLTAGEENEIKSRMAARMVQRIYDRGYVARARENAVATLTPLLQSMRGPFGKQSPVVVIDPVPSGSLAR